MPKYTLFEYKLFLMVYLIKKYNFVIDDLVTLTPKQAIELLSRDKDQDVANNLKIYVNKKLSRIKSANLFFPGKLEGSKSSIYSIQVEIYKYLKMQGLTLQDIGLSFNDIYRTKKSSKPIDATEVDDIFSLAKELLK